MSKSNDRSAEAEARPFRFAGFAKPTYTQVPDELFDELLPELTESELKVLLYVIRRTFGFKKDADAISIAQLAEGITTRDGRVLDKGTGLSRTSVKKASASLVEKGVLDVRQVLSPEGDYASNVFSLRFRGVGQIVADPRSDSDPPVGQILAPQETGEQETAGQDRSNTRRAPVDLARYDEDRDVLRNYVADFATEFADRAPLASSVTRAQNLLRRSGLSLDEFVDRMYAARAITKERSGGVRGEMDEHGRKQRMAYFFQVLSDLLAKESA